MKRFIMFFTSLVTFFMIQFAFCCNVLAFTGSGAGTLDNPYLVSNVKQLNEIRNDMAATYRLTTDIDLMNYLWIPIGTKAIPFTGLIDGDRYTINNLKISSGTMDYAGFIGYTQNAVLQNIYINNVDITAGSYAGGLAGYFENGTVDNCMLNGIGQIKGTEYIGGLIGYVYGAQSLSGCGTTINVKGTGSCIGGLVGYNQANISRCYAVGTVNGKTDVGGLIGYSNNNLIANTITECYAAGNVTGTESHTGGLVGFINGYAKIENCFALGDIKGITHCAGLIGCSSSSSNIKNCYSTGKVTGSLNVGGLIGYGTSTITNSYFDTNSTNITAPLAQVRTTEQLKQKASFAGWNMNKLWSINEALSYPYLKNLVSPFGSEQDNNDSSEDESIMSTSILTSLPLSKVEGLTCVGKTDVSITLEWDALRYADGYDIFYDDQTITTNTTTAIIKNLTPNTTYSFRVRAFSKKETSLLSNVLFVKAILYDPKTAYAKDFYRKCEKQYWLMDELELILNRQAKSLNTIESRDDFANIYAIGLADTKISGYIPKAIGELFNLEYLYLSNNYLSGILPNELYTLTKLKNLDLSGNKFSSVISEQISAFSQMEVLLLHNNAFKGPIPDNIGRLGMLKNLDIAMNKFEKEIPSSIVYLTSLRFLSISDNKLIGALPSDFSKMTQLEVLIVSNNQIRGDVANIFKDMPKVNLIDISNNGLGYVDKNNLGQNNDGLAVVIK